MDKVHVRTINPYERRTLHQMKRQRSNHVNSSHARVILLSSGRVCNREIAQRVGYSPRWVRVLIQRFNQGGLEAVEWYPYFHAPQNPRKFLADIVEQIGQVALAPPNTLVGLIQWSLSKLREYLVSQKMIANISLEWLRTLLKRFGIRWRHTKTWKESTDPEFWAKYRRIRRLYSRRPTNGRRICIDEFGPLNLQPRHGKCPCKKGKKSVMRHRATYHRTGGVRYFLAAFDLETNRLFGQFQRRKRWREFLQFLKWLRRRYPKNETLHTVMDNYSPHIKAEVWNWAKKHHVKFYCTPSNASWLNRIECQFTALKKFALENSDYRSHHEQQAAIESYLRWRNGQRQLAVQSWRSHPRNRGKQPKHSHATAA